MSSERRGAAHLAVVAAVLAAALSASLLVTTGLIAALLLAQGTPIAELSDAIATTFGAREPASLAIAIVGTALPLAVGALLMARRLGPLPEILRLVSARTGDVVWSVVGMVAVSTAAGALVSLLGLVEEGALAELNAQFMAMPMSTRLLMVPATALAPGIAEELFFRGWALSRGLRYASRTWAVVVSSLAFGVVHFDPGHMLAASLMGLYLAFVVMRTGSLLPVVVGHVANNALATLAPELNGTAGGDTAWTVGGLVGGALVGALMMWLIARRSAGRAGPSPVEG